MNISWRILFLYVTSREDSTVKARRKHSKRNIYEVILVMYDKRRFLLYYEGREILASLKIFLCFHIPKARGILCPVAFLAP